MSAPHSHTDTCTPCTHSPPREHCPRPEFPPSNPSTRKAAFKVFAGLTERTRSVTSHFATVTTRTAQTAIALALDPVTTRTIDPTPAETPLPASRPFMPLDRRPSFLGALAEVELERWYARPPTRLEPLCLFDGIYVGGLVVSEVTVLPAAAQQDAADRLLRRLEWMSWDEKFVHGEKKAYEKKHCEWEAGKLWQMANRIADPDYMLEKVSFDLQRFTERLIQIAEEVHGCPEAVSEAQGNGVDGRRERPELDRGVCRAWLFGCCREETERCLGAHEVKEGEWEPPTNYIR